MKLTNDAELRPYNSFGVSARAACLAEIRESEDLARAIELADSRDLPLLLLGGGTNVLFAGDFPGMVLLMRNRGIEIDHQSGLVRITAGENWHELVRICLGVDLYGLENLALIPGSAGAAPVQNIGAYGVELESFFVELELFDCADGSYHVMSRADCGFSYRDSVLKQPRPQPQVVCSLTLQLSHEQTPNLSYPALAKELEGVAGEPTPQDVFEAVCRIRRRKLPDPAKIGNAGSFFKNPVISHDEFEQLRSRFDSPPSFPAKEGIKVPAGWLLDQCGFKGYHKGAAGVSEHHALVLINRGGATGKELHQLAMEMRDRTFAEFGIKLEPEVRVIGA